MVSGIAHDFNNLLTTIGGQASLAIIHLSEDDPARRHVEKVIKAAEFAASLTHQILEYAHKGNQNIALCDLNQVIRDSAELMSMALPDHISLELEQHPEPLLIFANTIHLQQLVINLLLNATESIEKTRGLIKLGTGIRKLSESDNHRFVNGRSLPPGRYYFLEVRDNGMGMSEEMLQKIFSTFYTTKKQGHGLGLTTILNIAEAHHGAVDVTSQLLVGTTFTVLFPAVLTDSAPSLHLQNGHTHKNHPPQP